MILIGLMLILFVGGIAALLSERYSATWPRYVTLGALLLDLVLLMMLLLSPETGGADGMTASTGYPVSVCHGWVKPADDYTNRFPGANGTGGGLA